MNRLELVIPLEFKTLLPRRFGSYDLKNGVVVFRDSKYSLGFHFPNVFWVYNHRLEKVVSSISGEIPQVVPYFQKIFFFPQEDGSKNRHVTYGQSKT